MTDQICVRQKADVQQLDRCKKRLSEIGGGFAHAADVLSLAGNEVRLKILYLLRQEGRLCVCDLSDVLGMGMSAISQHLRKLRDRDVIRSQREGQTIFYELSAAHKHLIEMLFEQFFHTNKIFV